MNGRKLSAGRLATLLAPVVLLAAACGLLLWILRSQEVSSEIVERGDVTLRLVKSVAEPVPGFVDFSYELEVRAGGDRGFRRIAVATFDGDEAFDAERVLWVDDAHVVVPVLWRVLSSADGGRTWSEWDANRALSSSGTCCALVEGVEIDASGYGIARARLTASPKGTVPLLETTDFGRSWRQVRGIEATLRRGPEAADH